MNITNIRVFPRQEQKLKAYVTIVVDDTLELRNLRIIEGTKGLFVAMPARKRKNGSFEDIVHPVSSEWRHKLEEEVLAEYHRETLLTQFTEMPKAKELQSAYESN